MRKNKQNYSRDEIIYVIAAMDKERDYFYKVWEVFEKYHPKESRPEWLYEWVHIDVKKNENNNWVGEVSLMPKPKLKPNQHWEMYHDTQMLVEVDPITKEKFVQICSGPPTEIDVIFKVEIDPENGMNEIILDTDVNTLDRNKYDYRMPL